MAGANDLLQSLVPQPVLSTPAIILAHFMIDQLLLPHSTIAQWSLNIQQGLVQKVAYAIQGGQVDEDGKDCEDGKDAEYAKDNNDMKAAKYGEHTKESLEGKNSKNGADGEDDEDAKDGQEGKNSKDSAAGKDSEDGEDGLNNLDLYQPFTTNTYYKHVPK
ncbi:hypothetical protein HOY80DRAFT_1062080 [Tuber brumale]|nr:hypothetical protein HOY80DRAFT_1062080 [Tuber brumale]